MAKRKKPITTSTEYTTPVISTVQNLKPPKFQLIQGEKDLSEVEKGNNIQWNDKITITAKEA